MYGQWFSLIGIDTLDQHYRILYPHHLSGDKTSDLVFLKNFSSTNQILIAGDTDPYDRKFYQYWLELANESTVDIKILTSDLNAFFNDSPMVYFPTWVLNQRLQPNYQTDVKLFRFSFLSSQARFHRLYFFQQVKAYLTDQDCFAVYATNRTNQKDFVIKDSLKYSSSDVDLYEDVPYFSPGADDRVEEYFKSVSTEQVLHFTNEHNAYRSFINVTGESNASDDCVFLSEKTWKPIQSRCLVYTLGNSGTDDLLNKLGFYTLDQDKGNLTLPAKISYISTAMKDWDFGTCQKLYQDNHAVIEHNYNRLYSEDLAQIFKKYLQERLQL
jgi:hypothetical protein